MSTKAQLFIPNAIERARDIKHQMIILQSKAISLQSEWADLGASAMSGYAEFDFDGYGTSGSDFSAAMIDLATTHNAVALATIHSGGAYKKVTNLGIGS